MSKDLVIVESPAKARTIGRILSSDYLVTASMGHVRDLPERQLGVDIKNNFAPKYEVTASRKKVIQELKDATKKAKTVYLATDPDREGEAIAWHIYEILKGQNKAAEFKRVTFHEITKGAVQEAFDHPGELNMDRVNAQQARRMLDRIVGYQVSPLLWQKVEKGTSAGRVQSVALRLICERETEVRNFVPEEYWNMIATFNARDTDFQARLHQIDGEKVQIGNQADAERYGADVEKGDFHVGSVKKTPRQRRAAPPFITSTLQQAASSNLRFSPDFTMRIAQQLYEGVNTDGGPSGLITYMRTDSVSVSKEAQSHARDFIKKSFGEEYVPEKPNAYRSRGNAQEAHEAIRPTDVSITPERAAKFLDPPQQKLYRLIWNRFIASQMAAAKQMRYTVEITSKPESCEHRYLFRATSTMTTFAGFLQVYNLKDVEEEDEEETTLPELSQADECALRSLDRQQKFTEPPPRFSEAMLVRELEKNGIGRPSTYASIVNTIQQRTYVQKEQGKLVPTQLGFTVNDYLISRMPKLFEVDFTARMENELDEVESGSREWHDMLKDFYGRFSDWLGEAKFDGPGNDTIARLLAVFPENIDWEKPAKRGKRTYDDKKFFESFKEQLAEGKEFSGRQWDALLQLAVKYEKQGFPELEQLFGDNEDILKKLAAMREQRQQIDAEEPREDTLRLMASLDKVKKWEEPVTRGKRTYDDRKFLESLRERTDSGRMLTPPQLKALMRLVVKYRDQLEDYQELRASMDEMPAEPETVDLSREKIDQVFGMMDEIKTWEPPRARGKRKYDDKEFMDSLRQQHKQGRQLSERQWQALQKVLGKYTDQIPDFEQRAKSLELSDALPAKPEKTGVKCPQCNEAELIKRTYRKRVFYGCEKYPKCDYTSPSLEDLKEPKRA